jgi:hypothetical protein
MNQRKKLSDILHDRDNLRKAWDQTEAAAEFAPLPPGEYTFRILSGELFMSKRGTPGYKLTLEVTEGEHEGRRAWCDFWLTPAALPMTKRDLTKIGVNNLEQLEQPLPVGILIRAKLALRRDDDGIESNQLRRFQCIGIEPGDAFEPPPEEVDQGGTDQGEGNSGNATQPDFPFRLNTTTGKESSGRPAVDANGLAPTGVVVTAPAESDGTPQKQEEADTSAAPVGGAHP